MSSPSELPEVGPWAEDKHARIRAYLELAAKTVGKKFIAPGKAGFFYIDCGARQDQSSLARQKRASLVSRLCARADEWLV